MAAEAVLLQHLVTSLPIQRVAPGIQKNRADFQPAAGIWKKHHIFN
jgi:hypothetical protein